MIGRARCLNAPDTRRDFAAECRIATSHASAAALWGHSALPARGEVSPLREEVSRGALELDISFSLKRINGSLFYNDGTYRGADIYVDHAINTAPTPMLGTNGADGVYTTAFQPVDNSPLLESVYAQGTGVGYWKLSKAGKISLVGTLVDGTPVTASTTLAASMLWLLCTPLYQGKGLIAGDGSFISAPDYDMDAPDSLWFRPVQDVQHYASGWPNGILVDMVGTRDAMPIGTSVVHGLALNGAATVRFSAGLLPVVESRAATISAADLVTNTSSDIGFTTKIDRATGLYGGTFTHTDTSKISFKGVILHKHSTSLCTGFFVTTTPRVKDYTGQGGAGAVVVGAW